MFASISLSSSVGLSTDAHVYPNLSWALWREPGSAAREGVPKQVSGACGPPFSWLLPAEGMAKPLCSSTCLQGHSRGGRRSGGEAQPLPHPNKMTCCCLQNRWLWAQHPATPTLAAATCSHPIVSALQGCFIISDSQWALLYSSSNTYWYIYISHTTIYNYFYMCIYILSGRGVKYLCSVYHFIQSPCNDSDLTSLT